MKAKELYEKNLTENISPFDSLQRLAMPDDKFLKECERLHIHNGFDYDNVEKVLEAFYIIKEKKVYIRDILSCKNAHEYNLECNYEYEWLTDEKFDFLKEMLK